MKRITCFLGLIAFAYGLNAQNAGMFKMPDIKPTTPNNSEVIKLDLKATSTVSYTKDVVYVKRGDVELHLQILSPMNAFMANKSKPLPCIVYVPGSAWMKQNCYMSIPQLSQFAAKGYVVAIVEYRYSGIAPFPAQVEDCKTAVRYMRMNAQQYGVDVNNVFIWGDSSGAHTVLMAGMTADDAMFDTSDYNKFSDSVNGIIAYFPPTDLPAMSEYPSMLNHKLPNSPEGMLIGNKDVIENKNEALKASPINYVSKDKKIPPIILAAGDIDMVVPFNQSDRMADKLKECGKTYEFYDLVGAGHEDGRFWSTEIQDIVEKFIHKYEK